MRKKVLIGNWKMNLLNSDTKKFINDVNSEVKIANSKNIIVGIAPTFLSLATATSMNSDLLICAQNVNEHDSGAFTGEISIAMLQEIKVNYSLVGHSERRQYYNETNASCNAKIKKLFSNQMIPVYCVGETLNEYETLKTKDVVKTQLIEGLKDVSAQDVSKIIIAYEPVWSIGTGKNASVEIAEDVCKFIREVIESLYNKEVAEQVIIQYGGSVKPNNIAEYLKQTDIDGALVGGASLKAESFLEMIKNLY